MCEKKQLQKSGKREPKHKLTPHLTQLIYFRGANNSLYNVKRIISLAPGIKKIASFRKRIKLDPKSYITQN